jgi:hypothetical protein
VVLIIQMKSDRASGLIIFLIAAQSVFGITPLSASKDGTDKGAVHSLGNGKMLVYEQGPQITHMYPGPYSTPSIYKVQLTGTEGEVQSNREQGTAIWTHEILTKGEKTGRIIDFMDISLACMVRHIETSKPISFEFSLKDYVKLLNNSNRFNAPGSKGGILMQVPAGTIIYQNYVYPRVLQHQVAWEGSVTMSEPVRDLHSFVLTCKPGISTIYFIGGPEYPQVIQNTEEIFRTGFDELLRRTRSGWEDFKRRRTDFSRLLPDNLPQREKLIQVIDDVAVLLKTQQSVQGSVLAGYPFPLGYVRDQYGVSRGLLALGCYSEAKAILDFYWQIWKKFGKIHNAQTIGLEAQQFHIHENDAVESTGYLIIQAFDYLQKTGDKAFLNQIIPMLVWAFDAQKAHLVSGMLPFNGDETYIAGGLLPRTVLNDGSAEATMLFIDGGEKLLTWIEEHKLLNSGQLKENKELLRKTRETFLTNFWKDGHLITNNPLRSQFAELPRFRHGVCERNGPDCLMSHSRGFSGITWTERDSNGRYQCPNCIVLGPLAKAEPKEYDLVSVSLTPLYFHSGLLKLEQLKPVTDEIIKTFLSSGKMPGTNRSVGYEYGMLLYAATVTGNESSSQLYEKTLSLADVTGAWAEYYQDGKPMGTRCRPWESAINLGSLLTWANK